jgi:putative transposase
MIDENHRKPSLACQCRLIGFARSTAYHRPESGPDKDTKLRNRIDEIYTGCPFFGSRQIRDTLRREGWRIEVAPKNWTRS